MSWFSVLPVVATLLAEPPASVAPADPVVPPIAAGHPVAAPPAPAPADAPAPALHPAQHGNREAPAPPEQTVWYGWETLASDATAIVLFVGAYEIHFARSSTPRSTLNDGSAKVALGAGLTVYALGAPVVHLSRRNGGKAAASVALRLGLPLLIGGLAASSSPSCGDDGSICAIAYGLLGASVGAIAAMAIDAAVLARKRAAPRAGLGLQPAVVPVAGGARFVLGGRF
jgi:hypothetical protein